jgi:hypothetical protein
VCDYSRTGQHQHGATAWQTYQDANENVIYGGRALGNEPSSMPMATVRANPKKKNAHRGPPSQGPGAGAAPRSVAGAGAG